MATSNRDVTLKLSVETLGEDGIKELQKAVEALGRDGGAAAPEFQKLADEIGRLGEQSKALSTFRELSEETDKLAARQADSAASTAQMVAKLQELSAATAQARDRQREATNDLVTGQQAQAKATAALRELKAEYNAAGKNTKDYRDKLLEAVQAQSAANIELVTLRQNQREANAEVTAAVSAQSKLETQYKKSAAQVERLDDALGKQNEALREATTAAEALGVSTADVATAEGKLLATFNAVGREAATISAQLEILAVEEANVAQQAEELAAALAQQNLDKAAAETAALAQQTKLLEAEQEFATETARHLADAQQRVADEAARLAQVQKDDFAKQLVQAQALLTAEFELQAAIAADLIVKERALADAQRDAGLAAEKAAQDMADAAQKAGQRIDNAFGTLGVRSVQAIRKEITDTRAAMTTLAAESQRTGTSMAGAFAAGENKIKTLEREIRELSGTLTFADKSANLFRNSLGQIAAGNLIADAVGAMVEKVKELAKQFVTSIVELDTFRRALNAVYKDTGTTARQLEFLRKAAGDSGVAVGGLSASFVKFSASMKSANVPVEQSNALFASLTRAAGSLGLGAERTSLALDALSQIASKGVVSMEELRQQLGDSLPGALSLTAKGLGITDAELVKLVESGQLAARDFFPAFTNGLKELHGETQGLLPTWERLKNAFTLAAQTAGDAGWLEILTLGVKALGVALGAVIIPLSALSDGIVTLIRVGATFVAGIATWTNPLKAVNDLFGEMATRQGKVVGAFSDVVLGATQVKTALADLTSVTAATNLASKQAGDSWASMSRSQQASAIAAVIASGAHRDLSAALVATTASTESFLSAQSKETDALGKLAKATKDHGESMVAMARLRGDEKVTIEAIAQATFDHAVSLDKVAASRAEEVRLLELELVALERTRKLQGDNTEEIKKQAEALNKKITVSKAEAAQDEAAAESARKEAVSRQLASEAYKDNSAKMEEYREQLERANELLKITEQLEKAGAVGKEELRDATEAVANAQFRYSDTIRDTEANQRLENETRRATLLITKESLSSEVELLQVKAQQARNSGLLVTALSLEREAKQKQLEIERLLLDIKEIELKILRDELKMKSDLLALQEPENENKRKELELRIKLTEIQEKQIASGRALLGIKEKELSSSSTLSGAFDREASSRGSVTEASEKQADAMAKMLMQYTMSAEYSERQIALLEREAAAAEKAAEAKRKYWNVDKEGYSLNTAGERVMAGESQDQVDRDIAQRYGAENVGNADAQRARQLRTLAKLRSIGNGLVTQPGLSADERRELQELEARLLNTSPGAGSTNSGGSTPSAPSAPTGGRSGGSGVSGGTKTVTVNINGRNLGVVNGLNDQQAAQLTSVLRGLENAQGTAA